MKQSIYIFCVLFFLTGSVVSAKNTLTLQQCIDTALLNNRNVKQQELTRKTKEIAYDQARMDLLPNLNA